VEDVARAMARAVDDPQAAGKSFDLCGPKAYTLEQIVRFVIDLSGARRLVLPLPDWAAHLQATVFEHLPGPLLTRDNLRSMAVDNVCAGPFPESFGFRPASMEAIVPEYLAHASLKGRYGAYRYRAGR
jgi:NADH dehydrogenase